MGQIKRFFWTSLMLISGLLLTLAGFNLIEISNELIKYVGIILLVGAGLYYLVGGTTKSITNNQETRDK